MYFTGLAGSAHQLHGLVRQPLGTSPAKMSILGYANQLGELGQRAPRIRCAPSYQSARRNPAVMEPRAKLSLGHCNFGPRERHKPPVVRGLTLLEGFPLDLLGAGRAQDRAVNTWAGTNSDHDCKEGTRNLCSVVLTV